MDFTDFKEGIDLKLIKNKIGKRKICKKKGNKPAIGLVALRFSA